MKQLKVTKRDREQKRKRLGHRRTNWTSPEVC